MLPQSNEASRDLCYKLKNPDYNSTLTQNSTVIPENNSDWPVLTLPFLLVCLWILVSALGFVLLAVKGLELPNYAGSTELPTTVTSKDQELPNNKRYSKYRVNALLWLMCLFIIFVTGLDMTIQSKVFTLGLCGPLKMPLTTAGWLNTVFFLNYLAGRLVSIPLSTMVSPAKIILGSYIYLN